MSLMERLRRLDDNLVSDDGEQRDGGAEETKRLGMALAGANVLVLSLAVIPSPFTAPLGLLLSVPLIAPYAYLQLSRLLD